MTLFRPILGVLSSVPILPPYPESLATALCTPRQFFSGRDRIQPDGAREGLEEALGEVSQKKHRCAFGIARRSAPSAAPPLAQLRHWRFSSCSWRLPNQNLTPCRASLIHHTSVGCCKSSYSRGDTAVPVPDSPETRFFINFRPPFYGSFSVTIGANIAVNDYPDEYDVPISIASPALIVPSAVFDTFIRGFLAEYDFDLDLYTVECARIASLPGVTLVIGSNSLKYTVPAEQFVTKVVSEPANDSCTQTFV